MASIPTWPFHSKFFSLHAFWYIEISSTPKALTFIFVRMTPKSIAPSALPGPIPDVQLPSIHPYLEPPLLLKFNITNTEIFILHQTAPPLNFWLVNRTIILFLFMEPQNYLWHPPPLHLTTSNQLVNALVLIPPQHPCPHLFFFISKVSTLIQSPSPRSANKLLASPSSKSLPFCILPPRPTRYIFLNYSSDHGILS